MLSQLSVSVHIYTIHSNKMWLLLFEYIGGLHYNVVLYNLFNL